jgi:restriction endonuclease S subunit
MNAPVLRFKSFDDEWKETSVLDFAPLQRGFDLPVSTIVNGKFPVVFSNGILKHHNEYKAIGPGVVTGRSGTIGNVTYLEENYWPHNTSLWVTDFKNNLPKFVYYFYIQFDLSKLGTGSGVPTLNRNDVHNKTILIPSKDEQTKIANFLTAIDEKITQINHKHDLLTQYKKGVMQKIFSQELRFKDDGGQDFPAWEEKFVGEVFNDFKGTGLSKDKIGEVGKNKCILYGHLFTRYSEVITDIVSWTDFEEGFVSEVGDILMPSSTTTKGIDLAKASSLNQSGVLLGGDIIVLRLKEKGNSNFFAYLLTHAKSKDIAEITQGITIIHLYFSQLKNLSLNCPCEKEQTKIANFLIAVDEKITAIQLQLQAVKQYKQGLLQKMFV